MASAGSGAGLQGLPSVGGVAANSGGCAPVIQLEAA